MKVTTLFGTPLLALAIVATPSLAFPSHAAQYGPPQDHHYDQDHDRDAQWDRVPDEFHDAGRRGFHDGIEAAHRDIDARRRPDARRNPLFRRPPVERRFRDEYRSGFDRGYDAALHHFGHDRDHDHDYDHSH